MQLDFEFNTPQNTAENQALYDSIKYRFGSQCRKILDALKTGRRMTVKQMSNEFNIGDPRARIRDLRKHFDIPGDTMKGGSKEYYLKQH